MQPQSKPGRWLFIVLFAANIAGAAVYFGAAFLMALASLMGPINPNADIRSSLAGNFLLMCGLAFAGCVFLPAVYYSLQRMLDKPIPAGRLRPIKVWFAGAFAVIWLGAVLMSNALYSNLELGCLAAAPFYLLSISLPVITLAWIGAGGLPLGSRNRFWGTLGISTLAGPLLATMAEFVVYIGILLILTLILLFNPNWLAVAEQLSTQLTNTTDLETAIRLLSPYLMNPVAIGLAWLVFSVFVPLIEEAVKPLATWFLVKRLRSPAEGFAMGVLGGAGFALIEGLAAGGNLQQGWGALLAARAAGSLMHILASGVMGWGIVSAWQRRRFRFLAGAYLFACFIHGLWNTSAVLIAFSSIRTSITATGNDPLAGVLTAAGLGIMAFLVVVILTVLVLANRRLRPAPPVPVETTRDDGGVTDPGS